MSYKLLALCILGLLLMSCTKDQVDQNLHDQPIRSVDQLNVHESFDWRTSHPVIIQLKGLDLDISMYKTAVFKNAHQEVILKKNVELSRDYEFVVEYPDYMEEMHLIIGGMIKTSGISNGSVQFNYSKHDDKSDLDPADR